jgi:hypothetical protein
VLNYPAPLFNAWQTAAILGGVQKYTIQQHVKWWDNCIEAPNTYTICEFPVHGGSFSQAI